LAKLVINPTSAAKKEIPIVTRVISIGRDPSNDLVLSDSMVSRRHAILEHRDNQYILRDNNSSNGTMVNGDRVDIEKPLRDGDLVAIGSSRLLFQLDETAEASIPIGVAPPKPRPAPQEPVHAPARAPVEGDVRCGHCGKTALVGDRFCRGCGRELAAEKKTAVCSQCGNEVRLPAEFCGRCGKALAGRDKPPPSLSTRPHRRSELEAELVKGGSDEVPAASLVPPAPKPRPRPGGAPEATAREAAGFGIRCLAFLVDEMILGIPLLLGGLAFVSFAFVPSPTLVSAASFLYTLFGLLYYVYFWGARGATPGKSLLGLTVVTETGETPIGYGRALLRLVGYAASSFLLGVGFLLIAFSPDRRGLHDRIAGTRVERSS
jgi:uncharacterized RDD family membrane protein YckC